MSNDQTDWHESWVEALQNAQTADECFQVLSMAARELGFDFCSYGMRTNLPLSNPKTFLLSTYSSEWQQRYAERKYMGIDPIVAHGMTSIAPVVWSEELFHNCKGFWEDARGHGLKVGWSQSAFDSKGVGGLLSLARSNDPLTPAELRHNAYKLAWLVQAGHASMSRLILAGERPAPNVALTAREIEVLRWSADGKSSADVSEILNISERTVNFHIQNSITKLAVSNRTAAVIKAALLHLL